MINGSDDTAKQAVFFEKQKLWLFGGKHFRIWVIAGNPAGLLISQPGGLG